MPLRLRPVELLLGCSVVVLVCLLVFLWRNPLSEIATARDLQRRHDVRVLLDAVHTYRERTGRWPEGITTTPQVVCVTNAATCVNGLNLNTLTGSDITKLPVDPMATGTGTQYVVSRDAFDRITVAAPLAEREPTISVTK